MKSEPRAVLQQLKTEQLDPNSTTAREIVEEVAERVLRRLAPEEESQYFPNLHLTTTERSEI
jgi:hypothetical protein